MQHSTDLAILGAGAAGLATAIFSAQRHNPPNASANHPSIILLDSALNPGAKILVSGGGRCNVTHNLIETNDFNAPPHLIKNILARFNEKATIAWFASIGVPLSLESTGKFFPSSNQAKSVLQALLRRCNDLNVPLLTNHRVHKITRDNNLFALHHNHGILLSKKLVLATGGQSLPKTGSDGSAYALAKSLGHTVTPTYPALVPLTLQSDFFHASLAGLSHPAQLSTFANNKLIDRRQGSLLWTHFGLSGPLAMDASRHWVIANAQNQSPETFCNVLPDLDYPALDQILLQRFAAQPRSSILTILSRLLPERLAAALLNHAKIPPASNPSHLDRDSRKSLLHTLLNLPLPITGNRGWNYAEVTAGGVPLQEIDPKTMQSKFTPNLYLVGEILNCDGRIGGFNFQWAWSTAHQAAQSLLP